MLQNISKHFFDLALIWQRDIQMTTDMNLPGENQAEENEKEWEDPQNPRAPSDARDKEQIERQYEEAKRRKDNLTEKDHIDKTKKN